MSISDSFRDPSHGSAPDNARPDAPEISAALENVQFRVQHVDPLVRDCNRHLIDLLGPCPNTDSGNWVSVDDEGAASIAVHDIVDIARLGAALEQIARTVDLAEAGSTVKSDASYRRHLELVALDNTVPAQGQSLHLGTRRNNRNLKKGL
jgi:hypothetical protein